MLITEFREIIFLDTEFRQPKGDRIKGFHALAAMAMNSGQVWKFDGDQLAGMKTNPLPTGDDVLYVGWALSAEWQFFYGLGWAIPKHAIDLRYTFLRWRNGNQTLPPPPEKGMAKTGLLNALRLFSIPTSTDSTHKAEMRQLCIDNEVLPHEHRQAVLDYCLEDVRPLMPLLQKLLPTAGPLEQVLHAGRYAKAEAAMAFEGIPIDTESFQSLSAGIDKHIAGLVEAAADEYPFFLPSGIISSKLLAAYLIPRGIAWERTTGGQLKTDADYLKAAAAEHPELSGAYEIARLAATLGDIKRMPVGTDGRCRYFMNSFGTVSGRSAGSLNPFICKKWVRSLVKPPEGYAFVNADWSSQEIGIAAYLSGDANMKAVYQAAVDGQDVYMKFAELAGLVPVGARREDHELMRSRAKVTFLASNYGAAAGTIADKLKVSKAEASRLLRIYADTFSQYVNWGRDIQNFAFQRGELQTRWGWRRLIGPDPTRRSGLPNPRSILNWPVQATGAELMRMAAILCVENGLRICGTVHDSLMLVAPLELADEHAAALKTIMIDVTETALGMPSAVDLTIARYPDRYFDEDGRADWEENSKRFGLA